MTANKDIIRISAVIPTYNRTHIIGRSLESVISQSIQPDEIIVVDDGSNDNTKDVIDCYYDKVHYIYQDNKGGAAARNRGVLEATGEWIAFLDSDDIWFTKHIERMINAIKATSGAACFYFSDMLMSTIEGDLSSWELSSFNINGAFELKNDATEWVMMSRQPMMLQSSVFSRQSLLDCGGFNEELQRRHDTHLFFKLGIGGSVCAVAGLGTQMTEDGFDNRLTVVWNSSSKKYCEATVLLYRNILRSAKVIVPKYRKELYQRIAGGHRGLARLALAENRFIAFVRHITLMILCNPKKLIAIINKILRMHNKHKILGIII